MSVVVLSRPCGVHSVIGAEFQEVEQGVPSIFMLISITLSDIMIQFHWKGFHL